MRVALGQIAAPGGLVGGPFGSSLVNADYVDEGVPVIRGANMGEGRYVGGPFVFVSPQKFQRDLSRNSARPDDLVFTQRGTLGQVALVPRKPHDVYVVSQSQMRFRADRTLADHRFVYYAASTENFLKQIDDRAISTGVPHTNLGILSKLTISLPPLPEQQAIAEVLGALDDKIAANRTLADRADELMDQTFRSQPAGEEVPLSTTADFINGKAFTKGATGIGRVVVRIAELNGGIGGSTVFSDALVDDKHVARPGDILFAWSGSLTLHRWFRDEAIVNQHIFKVVPRGSRPAWLVYELLRQEMPDFKAIAADKATTMGHIQRHHLDIPVSVPREETVAKLDPLMSALWVTVVNAERESLTLGATRDALLPQLMSGKLRVRDAEKLASEAGA